MKIYWFHLTSTLSPKEQLISEQLKTFILPGSRLLMFLNCLDVGVCVTAVLVNSLILTPNKSSATKTIQNVFESVYVILVEATGFTTLLLSVTRCLSVSLPMYTIKGLYVGVSAGVYIGYTMIREITFWFINLTEGLSYDALVHAGFIVGGVGVLIVSVFVANFISVTNLLKDGNIAEQSREAGIQATVTVVILSALFCVLNTFFFVTSLIHFYFNYKPGNFGFIFSFGIFYAIPLNSALNPLVYFVRTKLMREYLIGLFKSPLKQCIGEPREETSVSRNHVQTYLTTSAV